MSVRRHRLLDQPVFVAESRLATMPRRAPSGLPVNDGPCPFCEHGLEPVRVVARAESASDGVIALRNRYPVVDEADGLHEVVVESRRHDADLPDYEPAHAELLFGFLAARSRALGELVPDADLYVFRNRGIRAGASQPHPHAQVIATRAAAPDTVRRDAVARAHHAATGRNLLGDVVTDELAEAIRIVAADDHAVAFVPEAPLRNFELWVAPRHYRGPFEWAPPSLLASYARMVPLVAGAALGASGWTDYNLLVRGPRRSSASSAHAYHHLEVVPRANLIAGFELLSGATVLVESPERYAARVREALSG